MHFGNIKKYDIANGEGVRVSLFVSGCRNYCKNCFNPETWNFNYGKEFTKEVEEEILTALAPSYINGLTILGGEPFEQPEALEFLCKKIKEAGLSIICFTGNTIDNIKTKHQSILKNIDLLIDGEFREEEKDFSRPWVGSKNQNYHFLSNKFNKSILEEYKNKIELNIQKDGMIFINGMGDFDELTKKLKFFSIH